MTPSQEAVERRPRHFGKSTLVTNQFMAAAKAGKKVKFEHPDYICFSRKSWEAQQKLISQELQKAEERVITRLEEWADNNVPETIDFFVKHGGPDLKDRQDCLSSFKLFFESLKKGEPNER